MKHYLSYREVSARAQLRGKRLAVSSLRTYRSKGAQEIPAPDAMVGSAPGWLPETIDPWIDGLPGQGKRRSRLDKPVTRH